MASVMFWWKRSLLIYFVLFVLVSIAIFGNIRWSFSLEPSLTQEEPDYWEWETSTRFSPRAPAVRGDDDICESFPSYMLTQVQVVLKIGSSEPSDRLETQLSTVTCCISNLLIVSDLESDLHGHRVHDILASLPQSFRSSSEEFNAYEAFKRGRVKFIDNGWGLDRFKFLPMVERAYEVNPTAKWFVFLEADTYLVWDNLFRLLDQFDPSVPLYMGSPSPGRRTEKGETTWFAYGGAGFVLSAAALERLIAREPGPYGEYIQPSLSVQYEDVVKGDCCGDSVLGWALYEKGIKLKGLWPMFNAHSLHGVPFGEAQWCQPVISLHKPFLSDMEGLTRWESQRNRTRPILYSDLFDYTAMGTIDRRSNWDNADWGGWEEPPDSSAHSLLEACGKTCHDHSECLAYTFHSTKRCIFIRTMRLGSKRPVSPEAQLTAGWDLEKIQRWQATHKCQKPRWMKPSITRIF